MERLSCRAARRLLLEADLPELRGEGEGPLCRHLDTCARCRAAADTILAAEEELDGALRSLGPRLDEDAAVELARRQGPARRPEPARSWWKVLVPVASAAALAGLLYLGSLEPERRPHRPAARSPVPAASAPGLDGPGDRTAVQLAVEVPEESRVMIVETRDPSVTVVWFF